MNEDQMQVIPEHAVRRFLHLRQIHFLTNDLILLQSGLDIRVSHCVMTQLIGNVVFDGLSRGVTDAANRKVHYLDLTEDVWRHFAHMVGTTLMIEPYKLGPQPVGATPNLYEIPPALPTDGQWSIPDAVVDTTSATFASAALAPAGGGEGDYQFELTLFDAAGVVVNANTLGITYVVPTTLDLTSTIPTANASSLGLVTASGRLVYRLHVDNNHCGAALQPPEIAGSVSADPCGLLRYDVGDSVTLHWTASHPHQFATFKHALVIGQTELSAPITTSGIVTPAPGTHTETTAVADLLGICTIAGFAETVSVWATATDGWSRQGQYDRHGIQAFALAPEGV